MPNGEHSRPRWAGWTSSRDKLEVLVPSTGSYSSWGATGPVGECALGGLGRARRILVALNATGQGIEWGNGLYVN